MPINRSDIPEGAEDGILEHDERLWNRVRVTDRYTALSPKALRGVLASLALVMLTASLDSTAVGTALPRIVTDLRGNDLYAWVFTAYLLAMTAAMPLWGSLSDRLGRRPVLFTGLAIFLVGSALCGLSQEMWQLVAFRGLQGVGAGAIVPISLAIIGDLFPPADRARLQAAFSSLFVLAFLIGPTLGGLLTDTVGWRWVFDLNLPVGVVALAVMWRFMPTLRSDSAAPSLRPGGVVLFVAAIVPFLLGIRNLPDGSLADPMVGGLMLVGLLIGVIFVIVEWRAPEPIIPVRLFRNGDLRRGLRGRAAGGGRALHRHRLPATLFPAGARRDCHRVRLADHVASPRAHRGRHRRRPDRGPHRPLEGAPAGRR